MILTNKQEEGLETTIRKYKEKFQYVVIAGYAGTGKTTLVRAIVEALLNLDEAKLKEDDFCYCAFTGKACSVLREKGNKNVKTLHKLLYKHFLSQDGTYSRMRNDFSEKVIIVDEVSMLDSEMVEELLSHKDIFVIFCGDPFQIPPVSKNNANNLLDKPDVFLNEIMRQSSDSGIIELSMRIRNGDSITGFKADDAMVLSINDLSSGMLHWSDIVLCGTNATRQGLNERMRADLGFKNIIEENEKIICLKNEWDRISDDDELCPLVNGTIGYLKNISQSNLYLPRYILTRANLENSKIPLTTGDFTTEYGNIYKHVETETKLLVSSGINSDLNLKAKALIARNKKMKDKLPSEFSYGYAITGHKSQGSQWNKVLVIEENFPFDKTDHARWLYTCVTRAIDKVVLVR